MKITLDQIKTNLGEKGWKVLSNEYINLTTDMEFECPEGHKVITPYRKLRTKLECPVCKNNPFKEMETIPAPKNGVQRVLALDQATQISGWSLWDDDQLIKYGAFKTTPKDTVDRLVQMRHWLLNLIANYQPDVIVFEDIQLQEHQGAQKDMGVTTYKALAELLGVLRVTSKEAKIDSKVISSNTWRKDVGVKGRSRADRKRSAQQLVKEWYDINVTEDEADAICLGRYGIKNCVAPKLIKWE